MVITCMEILQINEMNIELLQLWVNEYTDGKP
jgi:hypothetical protein